MLAFARLGLTGGRASRTCRLCLLLLLSAGLLVGCRAEVPETVGEPARVYPVDLSSPESSVRSYLERVTLAHRMANSEAAAMTHTPQEGVRVDSYIELNRQQGRGIDQELVRFDVRSSSVDASGAVLAAREEWRYRYFSLDELSYISPAYEISYETTYTLLKSDDEWLVHEVAAEPLGEVR